MGQGIGDVFPAALVNQVEDKIDDKNEQGYGDQNERLEHRVGPLVQKTKEGRRTEQKDGETHPQRQGKTVGTLLFFGVGHISRCFTSLAWVSM